jgi:hypothetical protein
MADEPVRSHTDGTAAHRIVDSRTSNPRPTIPSQANPGSANSGPAVWRPGNHASANYASANYASANIGSAKSGAEACGRRPDRFGSFRPRQPDRYGQTQVRGRANRVTGQRVAPLARSSRPVHNGLRQATCRGNATR